MLLYSNPHRCTSALAHDLSHYFVAYEPDGSRTHALKRFDTDTNTGTTLDDQEIVRPNWCYKVYSPLSAERRAASVKARLAQEDPQQVDRVVVNDQGFTSISFCVSKHLTQANATLWASEHRFSLVRSAEEHALALQLYREEKALDRIDPPLIPYLDRLNAPDSLVSTKMSCDGDKRGTKTQGYVDFRTALTADAIVGVLVQLRFHQRWQVTLAFRPLGMSAQRYQVCYSLQAWGKGWAKFEPALNAFCDVIESMSIG